MRSFLRNIFKPPSSINDKILQKKKFNLLYKLVAELFNSKNSLACFNTISNLIILILNIYNDKLPIDIYSHRIIYSEKRHNPKYKQILKTEFLID